MGGNGWKKVELHLNQIHSEGANTGDRDEERGERENDQTGEMQDKIQETESRRINNLLEEGKQVQQKENEIRQIKDVLMREREKIGIEEELKDRGAGSEVGKEENKKEN